MPWLDHGIINWMRYSLEWKSLYVLALATMAMSNGVAGCTVPFCEAVPTGCSGEELNESETSNTDSETSNTDSETANDTDTEDDGGPQCPVGTDGCPCVNGDDDCDPGLSCIDGVCVPWACGNGLVEDDETCDDGNTLDSDGCNSDCHPTRVVKVHTGAWHTCALFNSGEAKCWGSNSFGRLGYGDTDDVLEPSSVSVLDVGGKIANIGGGHHSTCAILESGALVCWGLNDKGQLGYGDTENRGDDEMPAMAGSVDLDDEVIAVVGGWRHTCALLKAGHIRCWGQDQENGNPPGVLGQGWAVGDVGDDETPLAIPPVDIGGKAIALASGRYHVCALREFGSVVCWGYNAYGLGYIGINTVGDNESPADVGPVELGGGAIGVSASEYTSCALLQGGVPICWGNNYWGQLGHPPGNIGDDETPGSVGPIGIPDELQALANGGEHQCGLSPGGAVLCWGRGGNGQLGNGDVVTISDPTQAFSVLPERAVDSIAVGMMHNCAVLGSGEITCWGLNDNGQLGYGGTFNVGDDELAAEVGPVVLF